MSDLDADIAELELSVDLMDLEDADSGSSGGEVAKPGEKSCKHCGETDQDKLFRRKNSKGTIYIRNLCKDCFRRFDNDWRRVDRKTGNNIEKYILKDSRSYDRKYGLENDLTLEFILGSISKGCNYCGREDLKMTLDRLDNTLGHTISNVLPACISCNYLRRDMPYTAWLILAPRIRNAVEKGLFGDWVCRARGSGNV